MESGEDYNTMDDWKAKTIAADGGSVTFRWRGDDCQIVIDLSKVAVIGTLEKAVITDVFLNVIQALRYAIAGQVVEEEGL